MQTDIAFYVELYTGQVDAHLLQQALDVLDENEMQRFKRFKAEHAAQQYLLGRLLIKTALAEKLQIPAKLCRIHLSDNGKPSLANNPDWHFSLAHCDGAVVVAVANQKIGVDVENVARFGRSSVLNEHFFSATVLDSIKTLAKDAENRHTDNELAALYWTAMEAIVKLEDTSIFSERSRFSQVLNAKLHYRCERDIALASWRLSQEFYCSVAIESKNPQPLSFQFHMPYRQSFGLPELLAQTTEPKILNTNPIQTT